MLKECEKQVSQKHPGTGRNLPGGTVGVVQILGLQKTRPGRR